MTSSSGKEAAGKKEAGVWTRLRQNIAETIGARRQTEMSDEFVQRVRAIEAHAQVVAELATGGRHLCTVDTDPYSPLVAALETARTSTMREPKAAQILHQASFALHQLGERRRKFEEACLFEQATFTRYQQVYVEKVHALKEDLKKRRLEMDDARAKVEAAKSMHALNKHKEQLDLCVKDFTEAADRLLGHMDHLQEKKENHRRAVRKVMEAELAWHKQAVDVLKPAVDRVLDIAAHK